MNTETISFKKLDPAARLPERGSAGSCGLDLYTIESFNILPGSRVNVRTGLAMAIPYGFYGRIAARSGLVFKHGINVLGGVIDADYRGEVVCLLENLSDVVFTFNAGDRFAQLIIEQVAMLTPSWATDLDSTERHHSGFGSTGR
jgi:deoxyuridine 5'-triphosphate nucleotidohydrolase